MSAAAALALAAVLWAAFPARRRARAVPGPHSPPAVPARQVRVLAPPRDSRTTAAPQPPPARTAYAYPGAPQLSASGIPGTLTVTAGCQFAIVAPDSTSAIFTLPGVTIPITAGMDPAAIRAAFAAAIRAEMADPALPVVFITGGSA